MPKVLGELALTFPIPRKHTFLELPRNRNNTYLVTSQTTINLAHSSRRCTAWSLRNALPTPRNRRIPDRTSPIPRARPRRTSRHLIRIPREQFVYLMYIAIPLRSYRSQTYQ